MDKWSLPRVYEDLFHPMLSLSSPDLVHSAFFSRDFPTKELKGLKKRCQNTNHCYGLRICFDGLWILRGLEGGRLLGEVWVVGGKDDSLMTMDLMERMAREYGAPIVKVRGGHNLM